jgi:hypothetical protein
MPLGQLPPGARGYLIGEQSAQRNQDRELQQLQGVLSMQGALAQQRQLSQLNPLQIELLKAQIGETQAQAEERRKKAGAPVIHSMGAQGVLVQTPQGFQVIPPAASQNPFAGVHNVPSGYLKSGPNNTFEFIQTQREPPAPVSERIVQDNSSPTGWSYEDARTLRRRLGAPPPTGTSDQPKLKPGERLKPDGTIEVIPGSFEWQRRSGLHSKDYQTVLTVNTKIDNATSKIDRILDEKRKGAFNSNFGGYNALATQYLPGETQNLRAEIDSLKSDMKSAGLELMRSGGGIGQMTLAEWPIVQDMIDKLTPLMSEDEARKAFERIRTYLGRIKSNASDVYKTEWGETQFFNRGATVDPLGIR